MDFTEIHKSKIRQTVTNLMGSDARIFVQAKKVGPGIQDIQIMVQSLRVLEDKLAAKTQLRERLTEPLRGLKTQITLIDPDIRLTDEHKRFRYVAMEF